MGLRRLEVIQRCRRFNQIVSFISSNIIHHVHKVHSAENKDSKGNHGTNASLEFLLALNVETNLLSEHVDRDQRVLEVISATALFFLHLIIITVKI
jgi:hypothetical protein